MVLGPLMVSPTFFVSSSVLNCAASLRLCLISFDLPFDKSSFKVFVESELGDAPRLIVSVPIIFFFHLFFLIKFSFFFNY